MGKGSMPWSTSSASGWSIGSLARVPVLKKSCWLLLKRDENLKDDQRFRLRDILRYNLKTVHACLLKESIQQLWGNLTDSAPSAASNSPYITRLASSLNPKLPTISSNEPKKYGRLPADLRRKQRLVKLDDAHVDAVEERLRRRIQDREFNDPHLFARVIVSKFQL
jgi:hypothetical protein